MRRQNGKLKRINCGHQRAKLYRNSNNINAKCTQVWSKNDHLHCKNELHLPSLILSDLPTAIELHPGDDPPFNCGRFWYEYQNGAFVRTQLIPDKLDIFELLRVQMYLQLRKLRKSKKYYIIAILRNMHAYLPREMTHEILRFV